MKYILISLLTFAFNFSFSQDKIPVKKVIKIAEKHYNAYIEKYPDSTKFARSTNADGSLRVREPGIGPADFFQEIYGVYLNLLRGGSGL